MRLIRAPVRRKRRSPTNGRPRESRPAGRGGTAQEGTSVRGGRSNYGTAPTRPVAFRHGARLQEDGTATVGSESRRAWRDCIDSRRERAAALDTAPANSTDCCDDVGECSS